jgi:hypothetical protein
MPVKKFKDPFRIESTETLPDSSKSSTPKITQRKSLKAPKSETASGSELALSGAQTGLSKLPVNGTPLSPRYNKEYLKERWTTLSGVIMTYLLEVVDQNTGRMRLHNLLDESKLKDIGIMAGIATEKVLLMSGQPTQIIAEAQQVKLDDLGKALKETLEKRGIVTVTERKVEIKQDAK